ncbi:hypothetical protein DPX16_5876 [Anabarilius grahami]|uniref:Uncharacterized protein n=1 Tax=Anabarilius grahami TaxID=495550 RepID=A0A3N0Y2X0_ANAGA|nr:hypothetical protein DPX16_5876 [Anabarilius grahami]
MTPEPTIDGKLQPVHEPAAVKRTEPTIAQEPQRHEMSVQPLDLSALPWLLHPLAPPGSSVLTAPQGFLIPPALPWSDITLSVSQTYRPLATLRPFTLSALSGSAFPPDLPWFSFPLAPPQSSGILAPLQRFITVAPPPGPSVLPGLICSPSSPWALPKSNQINTMAPLSLDSTVGLRPGSGLGPCLATPAPGSVLVSFLLCWLCSYLPEFPHTCSVSH